jgi:hypothetical protein
MVVDVAGRIQCRDVSAVRGAVVGKAQFGLAALMANCRYDLRLIIQPAAQTLLERLITCTAVSHHLHLPPIPRAPRSTTEHWAPRSALSYLSTEGGRPWPGQSNSRAPQVRAGPLRVIGRRCQASTVLGVASRLPAARLAPAAPVPPGLRGRPSSAGAGPPGGGAPLPRGAAP